jgi:geranylgeranyl diphosphate synthase type II
MSLDRDPATATAERVERLTAEIRRRVNVRLAELVPPEDTEPQQLHRAIRYSLLGSGKRIRPIVTVMLATHLGADEEQAIDPACAIEMVHTASLILDDLPLMDNATLRRGQPANHIVFGDETALLAALALLNESYAVMGSALGLPPDLRVRLVLLLADAIGCNGLISGQMRDLENWPGRDMGSLEQTNMLKTAALFVAGAESGARIAAASEVQVDAARSFARDLGLAFQLLDDLVDVSHTETEAGKNVEQDEHKATLVSSVGADRAQVWARDLLHSAVQTIAPLGTQGDEIAELARLLTRRRSQARSAEQ